MPKSLLRTTFACLTIALPTFLFAVGCGSKSDGDRGGGGGAGGGAGKGGNAAATCDTYCAAILANCTGANEQYSGMDQCKNSCQAYPAGKDGDTAGDSLACRAYHADAAKSAPQTHCSHAGPSGGDGVCGAACDGFCDIAMMYCTAANQAKVYDTRAACETDCKSKAANASTFNAKDPKLQEGANQSCLVYHVQEGSVVPADHCLGDVSPGNTCG